MKDWVRLVFIEKRYFQQVPRQPKTKLQNGSAGGAGKAPKLQVRGFVRGVSLPRCQCWPK